MASTTFEKPLDNDVSAISTNLGSPSSASAVTGADAFSKINSLNSKIAIQRQNCTMNSTYLSEGTAVCFKIGELLCVQLYDIKFKQAISVSSENNNIVLFTLPFNASMSHVVFTITPFNPNDNVVRLRIQGNKITPWWSAIQISAGEGYCGSVVSNIV